MLGKTANASYREYKQAGGTLLFTDWLHREKEKSFSANGEDDKVLLINQSLNDTVQNAIKDMTRTGGLKDKESGKTVFGIKKIYIIGSGLLLAAAITFIIVKKYKS